MSHAFNLAGRDAMLILRLKTFPRNNQIARIEHQPDRIRFIISAPELKRARNAKRQNAHCATRLKQRPAV